MSAGMEVMSVMNRFDNTGAKDLEHHDREEHLNLLREQRRRSRQREGR